MPRPITSDRKSRKNRKQMWIAAVAGSTVFSGIFFGSALDAKLLATEVQNTTSFEEGWKPFHEHLQQLSERSAWIGLLFLILAAFALPRARRAVRRYFLNMKMLQPRPSSLLLGGLLLLSVTSGYLLGKTMDRVLTKMEITGPVR